MGFPRAASGTGELLGRGGARREQPAPLLSRLMDGWLFMPAFAQSPSLLVPVPQTGSLPAAYLSGLDLALLPFLTPLPQLVFPPRNRHIEAPSDLLWSLLQTASSEGRISSLAPDRTASQAGCAGEACVSVCMLTLQPDRCLSELGIRVTAVCRAVC